MGEKRWLVSARTLIFLTHGDEILLMKRAADRRILPGRYNGLGGHIERGEDPLASAYRELAEEAGIRPRELRLRAIYHIDDGQESGALVFVFTGESPTRQLAPAFRHAAEGELRWLPRGDLPLAELADDLPHLLPRLFAGEGAAEPLYACLRYDAAGRLRIRFQADIQDAADA